MDTFRSNLAPIIHTKR